MVVTLLATFSVSGPASVPAVVVVTLRYILACVLVDGLGVSTSSRTAADGPWTTLHTGM